MTCKVRIGTSGWHYQHWRGPFYPEDLPSSEMLSYYLQRFDTVEINNSFYRLPTAECFCQWREATPAGFCFAVKASRFLTHFKKLKDPEQALDKFLPRVAELKTKLGPILFQLPPRWPANPERLDALLKLLPRKLRFAFEFRDPSWHSPAIYDILCRHNAAFCIYDLAGFQSSREITADFTYIRLHGPGDKYQGSYSRDALSGWAERISEWRDRLRSVFVYFDNDQAGYAARNALELKQMVEQRASH